MPVVISADARQRTVFTTGQVAKHCKVAPRTVSKWIDSGRLKGYRIPGSNDRRVPRDNLLKFLTDHGMPLGPLAEAPAYRVLLVGADRPLADPLMALLTAAGGFAVTLATDAFDAGVAARECRPDSVLIDYSVGRATAVSMAARLTAGDRPPHTAAVLGEFDDDAVGAEAKGVFADVYRRPFDVRDVADRLAVLSQALFGAG